MTDTTRSEADAEALGEAFAQADDRGLGPYRPSTSPGTIILECPRCRTGGAKARAVRGRVEIDCDSGCRDARIAEARHTGRSILASAYTEAALREAAARPLPWIVEDWCARGMLTFISGYAGVGKSLLTGSLVSAITSAGTFASWPVREPGPVLWIDAEQSEEVVAHRMELLDLFGKPATIVPGFDLQAKRDAEAIADAAIELGAVLVVIDSHRVINPGLDEDSSGDTREATEAYRRVAHLGRVGVAVLAHSGKASKLRGSSHLEASADVVVHLSRGTDRGTIDVEWVKTRVGAQPPSATILVDEVGGRLTFDRVDSDSRDPLIEAAVDLIDREGPQSANRIAQAVGSAKAGGAQRKRLREAVEDGVLIVESGRYRLGPKGAPTPGAPRRTPEAEGDCAAAPYLSTAQVAQHPSPSAPPTAPDGSGITADPLPGESETDREARVDAALDAELRDPLPDPEAVPSPIEALREAA